MALLAGLMLSTLPAFAQFERTPPAQPLDDIPTSTARSPSLYRIDGARHLYRRYADQVHDGKLPPMLHAIAAIRTTLDASGRIRQLQVTRQPAAAREVTPWILHMIRAAEPFPALPPGARTMVYHEVWLVTRDGRFQLHTLSEGQSEADEHD